MLRSMSSRCTGRFCSALRNPLRSFVSSNGSRRSSRLTTYGITSSGDSKVVKRSPHDRHSRRRRTWRPSPASRESMTFVSSKLQNGQCMRLFGTLSPVHGESRAQLAHGAPYARYFTVAAARVEHVRDPTADSADLGL